MSVFCNLGRTPWVYRAFSYQRLFADAEKGPMQIALGQSDICEFESYMPSHAVRSLWGHVRVAELCAGVATLSALSNHDDIDRAVAVSIRARRNGRANLLSFPRTGRRGARPRETDARRRTTSRQPRRNCA